MATELAKDYLNRLLAGRDLNTDEDAIVAELEGCYFSGTQKALIQCFRDMAKRYRAQAGTRPAGRAGGAGLAGRLKPSRSGPPIAARRRAASWYSPHAAGRVQRSRTRTRGGTCGHGRSRRNHIVPPAAAAR